MINRRVKLVASPQEQRDNDARASFRKTAKRPLLVRPGQDVRNILTGASSTNSQLASEVDKAAECMGDNSKELEERFLALLREYGQQHEGLEAELQRMPIGSTAAAREAALQFPEPTRDPADAAQRFRRWRRNFVGRATSLDRRLPCMRLGAERIRRDVEDAAAKTGSADSVENFIREALLQRLGTLTCKRNMTEGRQTFFAISDRTDRQKGGQRGSRLLNPTAWSSRLLAAEIEAVARRAPRAEGGTEVRPGHEDTTPPEAFSASSIMVLVRQQLSEDSLTQTLRYYLRKLAHCNVSHRARLWRRSLELRAVIDMDDDLYRAPLPLGVASRRHVQQALQELGAKFGCTTSIQLDKGKTFYHQVAIVFPEFFEKQQKRMKFKTQADAHTDVVDSPQLTEDADACVLRPSSWARRIPWCANIEPCVAEQGVLLKASYAAGQSPSRIDLGERSYARQVLENAARRTGDEWEADVDSVLKAERAFLAIGDIKAVAQRLNDFAERRLGDGVGAAARGESERQDERQGLRGEAERADEKSALPQPVLKGYYMLRHVECRDKRWQLLCFLNFCRFLQRRLVQGLGDIAPVAPSRPASSTPHGSAKGDARGGPAGAHAGDDRAGHDNKPRDFSSRALKKYCSHVSAPDLFPEFREEGGDGQVAMEREILDNADDGLPVVRDLTGNKIMHAAALDDLASLEREMLSIGSYYIHKYEASKASHAENEQHCVDRLGVLFDLYAAEVWFSKEKRNLLEVYWEIYEHTADPLEKWDLSQRIIDAMAIRPRLDLEDDYFTEAYAAAICSMQSRATLLRTILQFQIRQERPLQALSSKAAHGRKKRGKFTSGGGRSESKTSALSSQQSPDAFDVPSDASLGGTAEFGGESGDEDAVDGLPFLAHPLEGYGYSSYALEDTHMKLTPSAEPAALDEFISSACLAWKVEIILEEVFLDIAESFHPTSPLMVTYLERSCLGFALEQWKLAEEEHHKKTFDPACRAKHEDPEWLLEILRQASQQIAASAGRTNMETQESTPAPESVVEQKPTADVGPALFEADGYMQMAFADIRRRCGGSAAEMCDQMLVHLLEHVILRRALAETAVEVMYLETAIKLQSFYFNNKLETKRPAPLHDSGNVALGENSWIDPSSPHFAVGLLSAEMGILSLSTPYSVALHCSPQRIHEMRLIYQHERAWRNLVFACVQHNMLLADPQVRHKETNEVANVGFSREVLSDPGPAVLRKLAQTAELAGPQKEKRTERNAVRATEMPSFMDTSRHTPFMQNTTTLVTPILTAVKSFFADKWGEVREADRVGGNGEMHMRNLWYRLVPCSSLCITRLACDLKLRYQAAKSAVALRMLSLLIPTRLSPFAVLGDRRLPFIEKDGLLGSLFSIPLPLDLLQLHGIKPMTSSDWTTMLANAYLAQGPGFTMKDSGLYSSSTSPYQAGKAGLKKVATTVGRMMTGSAGLSAGFVAPRLTAPIEFDGPAATALKLLHELITLISLRYGLCSIEGDPLTLLRMQRTARYNLYELERCGASAGRLLSRTDPTFEALDNLRCDLATLARRVDPTSAEGGDNNRGTPVSHSGTAGPLSATPSSSPCGGLRDPERVLCILQSEISGAFCFLATLFRAAHHQSLSNGAEDDAAEIRRCSMYLEGETASTKPMLPPEPSRRFRAPVLASLPILAVGSLTAAEASDAVETSNWCRPVCAIGGASHPSDSILAKADERGLGRGAEPCTSESARPERASPEAMAMQWDVLRKDGQRYMAHFHPELVVNHPLLHPSVRKLLAGYAAYVPATQMVPEVGRRCNEPWVGPVDARLAPRPLSCLVAAVCAFSTPLRQQLTILRRKFYDDRVVFKKMVPLETADAEKEYFGAHALLDMLKDIVVCGELLSPPPTTKEALARYDAHFEIHFPTHEVKAMEADSHGLPTRVDEVGANLEAAYSWITRLVHALDRLLLAIACESLSRHFGRLVALRHHLMASRSARLEPTRTGCFEKRGGDLDAFKVDVVLRAANWLRGCSTFVQMEDHNPDGEHAYVFKDDVLNACVESILRRIPRWGCDVVRSRQVLMEQCVAYTKARLGALKMEMRLQASVHESSAGYAIAVRREVAERGSKLVFEVDRIHRAVKDLKVASGELEYRLSSEVWEKVWSAVTGITAELMTETGKFRGCHGGKAQLVAEQMRAIREHVAGEFEKLAARNRAVQGRAAHARGPLPSDDGEEAVPLTKGMRAKVLDVAQRDDVRLLRLHIEELRNRLTLQRTFHHLKCQAMRQKFSDQMRALRMTLSSNQEFWSRLAEATHQQETKAKEFCETVQEIALQELHIEDKVPQAEASLTNRQRLQQWKRSKGRQIEHMEGKVKNHKILGTVDVEGMLNEIKEKKELVQELRAERQFEADAVTNAVRQFNKKTDAVRADYMETRREKDDAWNDVQRWRIEAETSSMTDDERLALWRNRAQTARIRVAELEEEHHRLKQIHSAVEGD